MDERFLSGKGEGTNEGNGVGFAGERADVVLLTISGKRGGREKSRGRRQRGLRRKGGMFGERFEKLGSREGKDVDSRLGRGVLLDSCEIRKRGSVCQRPNLWT
jgi:hypothetical protein